MSWSECLGEAWAAIHHYGRRSLITIVSLGWGVASFILLMAYGQGFKQTLITGFQAVGQDLVIMSQGQTSLQAGGMRAGRPIVLDLEDVEAIRESVPIVKAISPELLLSSVIVRRGVREKQYGLRGVRPEYQHIRNMRVVEGRWISAEDEHYRHRIAVLGYTVARELFRGVPPVGEEITIQGIRFTVVGVLDGKGQLANYGRPDNECIFIPYSTVGLVRDIRHPHFIVWTPVATALEQEAIRAVRSTLATRHRFSPQDDKAVFTLAFNQFRHLIEGMSLAVEVLLGFVGALTLGIGGVGLANIMLASVVDRTREIGVLKALGGSKAKIRRQFLLEALLIVAMGGLVGVMAGFLAVQAIGTMPLFSKMPDTPEGRGDVTLLISLPSVLISCGVLAAVGLVAGLIPAIRASRLNPIEALRYE